MMGLFEQKLAKDTKERTAGDFPFFPSLSLLPSVQFLLFFIPTLIPTQAEVSPAELRIPKPEAWTGERLPVYIDLYARGSFSGASSFSIPEIPGTLIVKIGGPVISSKQIEGESWSVQTHEFALFSQKTGTVEIPVCQVRFGARDGFTGPVKDIETSVPASSVLIRRPPGTEDAGFLITVESLDVTETWNPEPASAKVGDVFKRTIVQRADQMTGMAFVPAPTTAPDGFRIYPPQVETNDKTERGQFLGERRETITYQVIGPGNLTLPEIRYFWWNPKSGEIQSKSLPEVNLVVPVPPAIAVSGEQSANRRLWPRIAATLLFLWLLVVNRHRLAGWLRNWHARLNPPDKVAARKLLAACGRNDAPAGETTWESWLILQPKGLRVPPELRQALLVLRKSRYGPLPDVRWQGDELASEFGKFLKTMKATGPPATGSSLPVLNP